MPKHNPPKSTPENQAAQDDSDLPAALPTDPPTWSRWVAPVALVCALIAVALAAWSLLKPVNASTTAAPVEGTEPAPDSAQVTDQQVTDQQVADAEARACAAFNIVRSAVVVATNADAGGDPGVQEANIANARLSSAAGAAYLRTRLDPATPPPLALELRSFAEMLEDIAIHQLAAVPNDDPAQATRMSDVDAEMTRLGEVCS